MTPIEDYVQRELFKLQDTGYRTFNSKLLPTVDPEAIIGVRAPALRAFARAFARMPESAAFMQSLPHRYFEENGVHAFLIERIQDYGEAMGALNAFLPYVDNWATCDSMRPACFKRHLPELYEQIKIWIRSEHPYTVRFALGMLMTFYLDEHFTPESMELAARVRSEEYYVNMMIAWYFATALAKQYPAALTFLENRRLALWTHNKAIQKAIESYRITPEQKDYLRTLKIKK
jgi:3-methyladenine DNA glycosylase AlkD